MLKKNLGRSTLWMSAAASGNSVVSFFIFVFLSRILAPEEIGLVAFTLIFVEAGKIIVNAGFPQAIVQHHVWDEVYASTCFYINLAFALILTLLVLFAAAPLVAHYYDPKAGPILQVLSAIFFIEGIKAVHEGKLKRAFSFKVIAIRTTIGGVISGTIGILLALKGFGVWALVWQQLINHCVITLLTLFAARWHPLWRFSPDYARRLVYFSSPLMFAQLIGNISSKLFELLIGVFIGPAALGFFRVGSRALFILQDVILKPFEHTVLSALARIPDRPHQAASTLRVIRMSAYLTLPVFFGAAAIGPDFITFAFGKKWEISGNIMTVLSLGIAPLVIGYQINSALTACGKSKLVMVLSALGFITNCIVGVIAIPYGLLATAWGFSIRNYLTVFFSLYFFKRIFGESFYTVIKIVAPTFIASALMFGSVVTVKIFFLNDLPMLLRLIVTCLLGAAIYGILMVTLFRKESKNFFRESLDLIPDKLKPVVISLQRILGLA